MRPDTHLSKLVLIPVVIVLGVFAHSSFGWYSEHQFKSFSQAFEFWSKCKIISLVLCAKDIPVGNIITRDDLKVVLRWEQIYPQMAVSDPSQVIGKRARKAIQKGMVVSYPDVGPGKHPDD